MRPRPGSPPSLDRREGEPGTKLAISTAMKSTLSAAAIASLTLGLAPFAPEPHILGKLRWVAGGANGMALMDWGDLAFHGAPWIWLGIALIARLRG